MLILLHQMVVFSIPQASAGAILSGTATAHQLLFLVLVQLLYGLHLLIRQQMQLIHCYMLQAQMLWQLLLLLTMLF